MSAVQTELDGFRLKEKNPSPEKLRPYVYWDGPKPTLNQFQEYTLIVAAISVANLGQMTVELIKENLSKEAKAVRRGYFVCPKTLVAVAGGVDSDANKLRSSCEIFVSDAEKLVILQHHGVIASGQKFKFAKYLGNFIRFMKISKVVVLSSSFASQRRDSELDLGPSCVYYARSSGSDPSKDWNVSSYGWKECEPSADPAEKNRPDWNKFPGSGIAPLLFESCAQNQVENLTLFLYTSDGDNRQEASFLFTQVNRVLKVLREKSAGQLEVKTPPVWDFKSIPPPEIY